MCDYLKEKRIKPNITVADITRDTAAKLAANMGAVAVSYHQEFDDAYNLLADQVQMLSDEGLEQVNIHFVISQETEQDLFNLVKMIKTDDRFKKLNAIVLLGLKVCGRAKSNDMKPLTFNQFSTMAKRLFGVGVNLGFDSCMGPSILKVIKDLPQEVNQEAKNNLIQMIEPCESFGLFSSYVDVNGIYSPCSFCAGIKNTAHFDVVNSNPDDFAEFWKNDPVLKKLRNQSLSKDRECLYYSIHSEEKEEN